MKKSIAIFTRAMIGTALVLSSLPAGAMAAQPFDGVYNVDVVTKTGACDRYHWTVSVANGHVSSSDAGMIRIVGLVDRRGGVSLTFRGQGELARAGGRLKGSHGSGTWTSPTLACAGIWHAQRES